jgi:hypothetical protein
MNEPSKTMSWEEAATASPADAVWEAITTLVGMSEDSVRDRVGGTGPGNLAGLAAMRQQVKQAVFALAAQAARVEQAEPDAWREVLWEVALALNCLPSTFVDGNAHVLRKAKELAAKAVAASIDPEIDWHLNAAFEQGMAHAQKLAASQPASAPDAAPVGTVGGLKFVEDANVPPGVAIFRDANGMEVGRIVDAAPAEATAKRLSPFDAVARAMDMASLLAGAVGMNDTHKAAAYSQRLRSHLVEYIYPQAPAQELTDELKVLRAMVTLFGHLAKDSTQRDWIDKAEAILAARGSKP